MTHPTDDPMREETGMEHIARDIREGRFPERSPRQQVPVAAAQQPALAPAADERDAMIEVIVQADDAYDRVQGGTWAGAIADAMLAAGYRKADALLAERDALIHDIERGKESESALLAELEQARGIAR